MGSFISWLDHSEADQRRVREMLRLFSDKDTVDDLGLGTVRDTISNALFPGTSVIQTACPLLLVHSVDLSPRRTPKPAAARRQGD